MVATEHKSFMDHLIFIKDEVLKKVDDFTKRHPSSTFREHLVKLERKSNVPAPAIFLSGSALSIILLVLLLSMKGLALLAGFGYPFIATLRAIRNEDPKLLKFFMKYWLLFNVINVVDSILPLIWIPFYSLFKLLFVVWSFHPKTQGTNIIYAHLRPLILQPLGIKPLLSPVEAKRKKKKDVSSLSSSIGAGGVSMKEESAEESEKSLTLKVELAARGLEKPPEPERLDTLCQLRVLPCATSKRKAALDEGQWYKTPTNTRSPEDEPDWRHDPQFIHLPTLLDNILEVLVINKMSWKDQPLGKIRLELQDQTFPLSTTLPLQDPNGEGLAVQGEVEVHLSLVEE